MFYLSTENITDRKNMEEALRVSREELQLAISQTGRQVCHLDVPTRELTVSEEYARRHGIPRTLHGLPYSATTVLEKDLPAFRAFYEEIYAGKPRGEAVIRFQPSGGGIIRERLVFTNVFDQARTPQRAVISIEELTADSDG